MKFTSISLVMPILVRILAMHCYATPIARLFELQDRGLPYHKSPLPSYPVLQLPEGSRCFFALNYVPISPPKNKKRDKSKRLNLKGNQLKPNGEKFCVLISGANFLTETNTVYSKEPHDPTPNTVRFYKTQMDMDHTLLTNEQIGFTGLCYTQIETQKSGDLEIPWQDWAIPDWPTDNDHGTRISVGNIERHHKAEASMRLCLPCTISGVTGERHRQNGYMYQSIKFGRKGNAEETLSEHNSWLRRDHSRMPGVREMLRDEWGLSTVAGTLEDYRYRVSESSTWILILQQRQDKGHTEILVAFSAEKPLGDVEPKDGGRRCLQRPKDILQPAYKLRTSVPSTFEIKL
ncbi:hypothetical protein F5051DRAFT_477906 [Lentinula edodes]|nr:hypothetical protein F5051DRAFT_477906 [Lentinula edodes]